MNLTPNEDPFHRCALTPVTADHLTLLLFFLIKKNKELAAPPKKRRSIYGPEVEAAPPLPGSEEHGLLLRPLSPITPPLPSDQPLPSPASYAALLGCYGDEERRLSNGMVAYSPLPSLPTSRCNTPLQFEVLWKDADKHTQDIQKYTHTCSHTHRTY